ncbi:hypothetical protein MGSAQ_003111 [marine sediment metagenome]|uniref:Uncharacterized protein n=1 Tax=marine sediment metagenome TaxID=412755 RepID=A0A1B6NPR7_9ZZZZ
MRSNSRKLGIGCTRKVMVSFFRQKNPYRPQDTKNLYG